MCLPRSPASPITSSRLPKKAVVGASRPAVDRLSGRYADWVIVAIYGLREYLNQSYRGVVDLLKEMPRTTRQLGLSRNELPDFSTLCLRKQLLKMPVWRDFLRGSNTLHELGEIQAIDASGMDRIGASQHYATKTNYTFKAVKTTLLVDCKTGTILDIHCSMKQPHDSQVGWQLLSRNLDKLDMLTADKGYDWELLRRKLQG